MLPRQPEYVIVWSSLRIVSICERRCKTVTIFDVNQGPLEYSRLLTTEPKYHTTCETDPRRCGTDAAILCSDGCSINAKRTFVVHGLCLIRSRALSQLPGDGLPIGNRDVRARRLERKLDARRRSVPRPEGSSENYLVFHHRARVGSLW